MPLQKTPRTRYQESNGFDVTCIIGTVTLDPSGIHNPLQSAFLLIADHCADGTYQFPNPYGETISVIVEGVSDTRERVQGEREPE